MKREQTHQRILEAASKSFKENGLNGVGLVSIMKEAGLTHGGFYAHFESKNSLIAQTATYAMGITVSMLGDVARKAPAGKKLEKFLSLYLSKEHRDNRSAGCFAAAVLSEASTLDVEVKAICSDALQIMTNELSSIAKEDGLSIEPLSLFSQMMGTIIVSRILKDQRASNFLLKVTLEELTRKYTNPPKIESQNFCNEGGQK